MEPFPPSHGLLFQTAAWLPEVAPPTRNSHTSVRNAVHCGTRLADLGSQGSSSYSATVMQLKYGCASLPRTSPPRF